MADFILRAPKNRSIAIGDKSPYKTGYDNGYSDGYETGRDEGYVEGSQAGYDKGIADQKAVSVDWDIIQDYGNRTAYNRGFAAWGIKECNPKYAISPTATNFINCFQACTELETVDWSKFDLSACTSFSQAFNSCFKLKSIDADLVPASLTASCWQYTFSGCWELERIQKIKALSGHTWTGTFNRCDNLAEIRFTDDSIIDNDISFIDCSKLSKESIESIFEALTLAEYVTVTFNKTAVNNAYDFDIDDEATWDYSTNGFLIWAGSYPNWTIMVGDKKMWE